jgi:hypothetical protein
VVPASATAAITATDLGNLANCETHMLFRSAQYILQCSQSGCDPSAVHRATAGPHQRRTKCTTAIVVSYSVPLALSHPSVLRMHGWFPPTSSGGGLPVSIRLLLQPMHRVVPTSQHQVVCYLLGGHDPALCRPCFVAWHLA